MPAVANAQKIPGSVVGVIGAFLLAPILAVPLKKLISNLFGISMPALRLWGLCAMDWALWVLAPYLLFVLSGTTGTAIGIVLIFVLSTWMHCPKKPAGMDFVAGAILALMTPTIALAISLVILTSG